ncbi:hypothetical protein ED208_05485 [Stagnimonas aquatica]|uniref:PIN domain-containing protein n=1 Tax=Stagnimonas aquatica TaxID=2689987 RepID=A0A3N0VGM5_9GAMM|nr:hypothetical protein [Stagnimonas aquatica]ROH91831.1 hypothetical protein ED208_05485 [Stagnimonas aquatica]
MTAVVDNDVLVKSTRYNLLDATTKQLVRRHSGDVIVQHSLAASCDFEGRLKHIRLLANIGQRDTLHAAVKGFKTLTLSPEAIDLLTIIPRGGNIQSGDALWLAAAAVDSKVTIYTGDKKALVEIANNEMSKRVADMLRGRCVIFPELLLMLINAEMFNSVRAGVMADQGCDPGINNFFPNGVKTARAEVVALLQAEIAAAHKSTHGLVNPPA